MVYSAAYETPGQRRTWNSYPPPLRKNRWQSRGGYRGSGRVSGFQGNFAFFGLKSLLNSSKGPPRETRRWSQQVFRGWKHLLLWDSIVLFIVIRRISHDSPAPSLDSRPKVLSGQTCEFTYGTPRPFGTPCP